MSPPFSDEFAAGFLALRDKTDHKPSDGHPSPGLGPLGGAVRLADPRVSQFRGQVALAGPLSQESKNEDALRQ